MKKVFKKLYRKIETLLARRSPWYKQRFQDCEKFWNKFDFYLDVVNLGSGSAFYGFDYSELPIKGANWAIRPQSFPQDFSILKTYESFLRPRAIILIALCPYSSCFKNYRDTELEKYYTIVHPGAFENFSLEKCEFVLRQKNKPLRYEYKSVLRSWGGLVKSKAKSAILRICHKCTGNDFETSAKTYVEGWMKQFKIADMSAPLPKHIIDGRKKRVAVLKEMIAFCEEREFTPIMVLPPVTRELSCKFSQTFRENYIYSFLQEAAPDIKFLNYLEDPQFSGHNEFFRNALFLNEQGAKFFTKKVLSDLNLI